MELRDVLCPDGPARFPNASSGRFQRHGKPSYSQHVLAKPQLPKAEVATHRHAREALASPALEEDWAYTGADEKARIKPGEGRTTRAAGRVSTYWSRQGGGVDIVGAGKRAVLVLLELNAVPLHTSHGAAGLMVRRPVER